MAQPLVKPPPSKRKRLKRRIQKYLARVLAPTLLKLNAMTWRVKRIGEENYAAATVDGTEPVCSLWHQHVLCAVCTHQGSGVRVIISQHHDGRIIAAIAKKLGISSVGGSSSKGGAAAMRGLLRAAKSPAGFALTPDGPRGPLHSVAPGVLYLAATVRRPLVPVGFAASKCWQANSWDKMVLPKPFAKVVVSYGDPMEISREEGRSEAGLGAAAERLKANKAVAQAKADELLADWENGVKG